MSAPTAWPGRSRWIEAREIEPNHVVNVVGLGKVRGTIITVRSVHPIAAGIRLIGMQMHGGRERVVVRDVPPLRLVELFDETNPAPKP